MKKTSPPVNLSDPKDKTIQIEATIKDVERIRLGLLSLHRGQEKLIERERALPDGERNDEYLHNMEVEQPKLMALIQRLRKAIKDNLPEWMRPE